MVRDPQGQETRVICYSGGRADEHPVRFEWQGQWQQVTLWWPLAIEEAGDRYLRRYHVITEHGDRFVLTHDTKEDRWWISKG